MIPTKLEDWTYEIVEDLCSKKTNESNIHDFKANMPDTETLTKLACAFANTGGGFVILGVKERGSIWIIEGIENNLELSHQFGQKINATPTIDYHLPKIISIPNQNTVLAVFYIPPSPFAPHIPNILDKGLFFKRTNQGNVKMSYEEIRMAFFQYEEKREKLKLLYLELISNFNTLKDMVIEDENIEESHTILSLDSKIIETLIIDVYSIIGKNVRLFKILMTLRSNIRMVNTRQDLYLRKISLPRNNSKKLTRVFNEYLRSKKEFLQPLIIEALQILQDEFAIENPLEEK